MDIERFMGSADTEAEILQQPQLLERNRPVLSYAKNPVCYDIFATDTSAFDSMVYILSSLYIENAAFRARVNTLAQGSSAAESSRFVALYAKNGPSTLLYRWRSELFLKYQSGVRPKYTYIGKRSKITRIISEILDITNIELIFNVLASASVSTNCNCHEKPKLVNFDVKDSSVLALRDMFERAVQDSILSGVLQCVNCKKVCKRSTKLHDVLFLHWKRDWVKLEDLPSTIALKKSNYVLKAFVTSESLHYSAHYYGADGMWRSFDNEKSQLGMPPKKFLTAFFTYVRQN